MSRKQLNVLLVMADQMTAFALRAYGNRCVKTPRLDSFAEEATVFRNAYCNSPICASSRFSMLSGQLPSRIGAYDNAAEFPASVPTFLHHLRDLGYHTSLSGKMHFVGPDQLHGYEERLTTDIYPSDFGWTPDWLHDGPPLAPSGMSMRGVVEAGLCKRSLQLDYDEEVAAQAVQKIYDLARAPERQPFFFTASFTHPHNPFIITRKYWDLYTDEEIDMPVVPNMPYDARDEHSKRLYYLFRQDEHQVTEEHIRTARHAYFSMVSYVDEKVGLLLDALEDTGLAERTVVLFVADHGEMLGERGLWYKYGLFEGACRIPFMIRTPWGTGCTSDRLVSLLDVFPTVLDLATEGRAPTPIDPIDGRSVAPLLSADDAAWPDSVACEFTAEGAIAPCLMLREGPYKYIYSESDKGQLFDLGHDPHELNNLSGIPEYAQTERALLKNILRRWDVRKLKDEILASQRRRLFLQKALAAGSSIRWDFQPYRDASTLYVRSGASPTVVKAKARFPYVEPKVPDFPRSGR